MNAYAPIFASIVDSSLWCEDDVTVKVFITMLAKKDSNHCVIASAFNIGKWAVKTEAEVLDALKILSSPDTKRLEPQPFDGRRIEKVDGGWKILNGQKFEDFAREISRRVYQARWQREQRAKLNADNGETPKPVTNKINPKKNPLKKGSSIGPGPRERKFIKAFGDGDSKTCDQIASPDYGK